MCFFHDEYFLFIRRVKHMFLIAHVIHIYDTHLGIFIEDILLYDVYYQSNNHINVDSSTYYSCDECPTKTLDFFDDIMM